MRVPLVAISGKNECQESSDSVGDLIILTHPHEPDDSGTDSESLDSLASRLLPKPVT